MKKILAAVLFISLVLGCSAALAATDAWVSVSDVSTRSGPGTEYTEPGTFLYYGADVTVHTKVWDERNELHWVQIEFTSGNQRYRAYTGDWRLSGDLTGVPYESVLDYSWFNYGTRGYAGPGYDYHYYGDIYLHQDANCRIMEVENNFALVDTSGSTEGWTRVWVPLSAVAGGTEYYGQDTYPDYSDPWNDGATLLPGGSNGGFDNDQGATLLPGGSNGGYDNGYWYGQDYPIGRSCVVWVDSGVARSGPGTNYSQAGYIKVNDVLTILDSQMGNTGKDWYQVRVDGKLCWISSGLVLLDGNQEGTAYGVPIQPVDPYPEYPVTATYLVGKWARINASSAHVRQDPNTTSATVGYVKSNQYYLILECRVGSTGKIWYKIEVDDVKGWISSGLVTIVE